MNVAGVSSRETVAQLRRDVELWIGRVAIGVVAIGFGFGIRAGIGNRMMEPVLSHVLLTLVGIGVPFVYIKEYSKITGSSPIARFVARLTRVRALGTVTRMQFHPEIREMNAGRHDVCIEYWVGEKKLELDWDAQDAFPGLEQRLSRFGRRHPAGSTLALHYDPLNPKDVEWGMRVNILHLLGIVVELAGLTLFASIAYLGGRCVAAFFT